MSEPLRAPFPYFGYKGDIAPEVWRRLGNPPNYVEPFAGSAAVLLRRPGGAGRREVINDRYGLLCNFWRAVKHKPDEVVDYAVWVSSESDLNARNVECREALETLTPRLEHDPEHCDPRLAGYWCYVQCLAIGEAAFAKGPWVREDGLLVRRPGADGIRRGIPNSHSRGIQRAIPFHSDQGLLRATACPVEWIHRLSDRLPRVRILCGDWSRAVKPTYTTQHGLTGVFLDPPYDTEYECYEHSKAMTKRIKAWCESAGEDQDMRIAVCGYEGSQLAGLVKIGWQEFEWRARGGRITVGGQSDKNRSRERIWFSPYCLTGAEQLDLFEDLELAQ